MEDLTREPSGEKDWRTSSYCGTNACVQIALSATGALMRDSKDLGLPPLSFAGDSWAEFLAGVKRGEFDSVA